MVLGLWIFTLFLPVPRLVLFKSQLKHTKEGHSLVGLHLPFQERSPKGAVREEVQ